MTLAKKYKELRSDRRMSLSDVGKRCGLERTTIWKIENGILPRGATLQKACLRGLGLKKDSNEWNELQALWTAERTGQPITAQDLAGEITAQLADGRADLTALLRSAAKLDKDDFLEIEKAIHRPAVLQGLRALNALYEQTTTVRRSSRGRNKSDG